MAREVQIGDILKRIKRPVSLIDDQEYKLVTIRMNHKGVVLREKKQGALIKSGMYEVKPGDFILSGIDARNGAFGIVPKELDGAIVTNDFWYFEINEEIISKELFLEMTATTWFDEICKRGSDGTTQRIRLQKDKFFNQTILLPELEDQGKLLSKIHSIKEKHGILKEEIESQKSLLSQLKQSILQEAIQGKLTEEWRALRQAQQPPLEPASELLKRIQAEKARLINPSTSLRAGEKKIKKEKPLPLITESEKPFELPEGWEWCRLGSVFQSTSGGTPSRNNSKYWGGAINWYKSGELNDSFLERPSQEKITDMGLNESSATLFPKGTLLIAMYGATAGKLSILGREACTNQAVCGFYENPFVKTKYLFHFLFANRAKMITESWGMSQPNISQTYLRDFVFALPPAEEQQAIVEKVESLMEKCWALEKEISQSEQHAQMLIQAVLKEAFES
ncbi:MAG: restriction endonuclease subunit S [Cecembia sp.]